MDNSVRYNLDYGSVDVMTGRSNGRALLVVTNTGSVVEPAHIEEAFEPFRRLDGDRVATAGYGLGLSIVRSVAAAHAGSVDAEALPRGGLRVSVSLPAG
jgi:signal transduction histidine kinase